VIANNKGETEKAVEYAQKALELNPNDMWAFFFLGRALCMVGRYEESIANIRKAMRLTPHYPAVISGISGWSSFFLRRYKDALASGEEAVRGVKTGEIPVWLGNILMVAIYSELGQQDKTHKFASEIMGASPKWNLEVFRGMFPLKNQSDMDRVVNAARKAGLN
jgi:tetratricopeptide (TPR) repeat protein